MIEEIFVTFDILTCYRIVNVRLDLQGLQVCLGEMVYQELLDHLEKAYKDLLVHKDNPEEMA